MRCKSEVSILVKLFVTCFVGVLVPVYWQNYGPGNFLWLSDLSLFLSLFALWLGSPLIISLIVIGIFPFEIIWNIDFFYQLITGDTLLGLAAYMYDTNKSLFLRGLSLFHVFMPVIWLWYFFQWGYDRRALKWAVLLSWTALLLSYFLTDPEKSVNWVYHPSLHGWSWIRPLEWTLLLMVLFPLVYSVFHMIFLRLVKRAGPCRR